MTLKTKLGKEMMRIVESIDAYVQYIKISENKLEKTKDSEKKKFLLRAIADAKSSLMAHKRDLKVLINSIS